MTTLAIYSGGRRNGIPRYYVYCQNMIDGNRGVWGYFHPTKKEKNRICQRMKTFNNLRDLIRQIREAFPEAVKVKSYRSKRYRSLPVFQIK